MNLKELNDVSVNHVQKEKKLKHTIYAFLTGGVFSIFGQLLMEMFKMLNYSEKDASSLMIVTIVFLASFFTGIGIYDKLAQKSGAGMFVPISGFANALTSCAMEGKSEGLIYGIGTRMFSLAGSVITYGVVSAYVLGMIRYVVSML